MTQPPLDPAKEIDANADALKAIIKGMRVTASFDGDWVALDDVRDLINFVKSAVTKVERLESVERDLKRIEISRDAQQARAELADQRLALAVEALKPFVQHWMPWMSEHPKHADCCVHSRHTFGQLATALLVVEENQPQEPSHG